MTVHGGITSGGTKYDPQLLIARGQITGFTNIDKFGRNDDIDTATAPEDIWGGGGMYTGFPTGSAETLEIFSSSVNDDLVGTGARTVKVTNLLDGTGASVADVEVDLDGTTAVSLGAGTYYRASRIVVIDAGSTGSNEGTLTLRHTTTTANIFAQVPIGHNQTSIMCSTVPLGQTLYIHRMYVSMARASGAAGSAKVGFLVRPNGEVFQTKRVPDVTNSQPYAFIADGYIAIPARADYKWHCFSVSDNNSVISAEIDGILIDD